jgi:hypothetical protein
MINGTEYDAHTGMPVRKSQVAPAPKSLPPLPKSETHSHAVHASTQKSQTLNRRIVKKATGPAVKSRVKPQLRPDIQKTPAISKFAPHPAGIKPQKTVSDIGPMPHPIAAKATEQLKRAAAEKIAASAPKPQPKPSHIIKQEAVNDALQKAPSHTATTDEVKTKKRYPRILSVASASLALLLLGGYFTYLNMPSLSVRVAAAQAGINASYPSYHPDGYSLKGAVAYDQGEVNMKFASNSGPQNFTVDQTKSSWDSSAVLENYVSKKVGDNYITYNEHGLTIYTFGGNAAWVNGGILYTISGDAPLSGDQIRHIATSM